MGDWHFISNIFAMTASHKARVQIKIVVVVVLVVLWLELEEIN